MIACPSCSTPNHEAAAYCLRCGASLPRPGAGSTLPGDNPPLPPRHLVAGDVVDHKYRIESVLGEGGMGIVFLARDLNTNTHVVVKAIRGELAHDPDLRERVLAEGRALAQIDHPNVVRLNAIVIENNNELYLIMQYIEGQSLDRLIETRYKNRDPLPFPQVLGIFRQIVAGVGAAHREGVVHRDIKPANVLLRSKDGVAKVTDFGIAKMEEDAKAGKGKTRGIIGSLWYMAPEQVIGRRDLDKRVDIYALGILFYEMLVGHVPFDASSDYDLMKMHVEAPFPSAAAERPDLPAWVDQFTQRACAKEREQRFPTCDDILAALEQFSPEIRGTGLLPVAAPPPATTIPQEPLALSQRPRATEPSHPGAPQSEPPRAGTTQEEAPSSSVTAPREELPPSPSRLPWILGAIGILGALGAGVWIVTESGILDTPKPHPVASSTSTASARPPASASASAPTSRLDTLTGRWKSESGRLYQAVRFADILEFRIVDPRQFEGQDYQLDEPRFVLSDSPGEPWFAVEDKIRPRGPSDTIFDPSSRGTCQAVWKSLQNEPLKAYYDGVSKLRVDMVNITPELKQFEQRSGKVVGCKDIGNAKATKIETTLTRE